LPNAHHLRQHRGELSVASNYEANKRWRANNPQARTAQRVRNYALGKSPGAKLRRVWQPVEDELIIMPSRPEDRELARQLSCSVQAIQARRNKLLKKRSDATTDTPRD